MTARNAFHVEPVSLVVVCNPALGGDEGGWARLGQRPVPAMGDVLNELGRHARDLRLRPGKNEEGLHPFVNPRGGDCGVMAVGDHPDQRRLRPLATLQQPLGEVVAGTQFRNRDTDRACPGVEVTVAVDVAMMPAL